MRLDRAPLRGIPTEIVLTVQAGRGFSKSGLQTKPDPYAVVRTLPNGHGDQLQTAVRNNTSEPVWGDTHEFNIKGETEFKIEVYDKDVVGKELIGDIRQAWGSGHHLKQQQWRHGPTG